MPEKNPPLGFYIVFIRTNSLEYKPGNGDMTPGRYQLYPRLTQRDWTRKVALRAEIIVDVHSITFGLGKASQTVP